MNNVIELEGYRFNRQGWINATEAAARFGKKPAQWLRLPGTRDYINALHEVAAESDVHKSHITTDTEKSRSAFVTTVRGGPNRGTWIHPDLAVHFARWLNAKFAVWCDLQIKALLGLRPGLWAQRDRLERELMAAVEKASKAGTDLVKHRWNTPPLAQHLAAIENEIQLSLEVAV